MYIVCSVAWWITYANPRNKRSDFRVSNAFLRSIKSRTSVSLGHAMTAPWIIGGIPSTSLPPPTPAVSRGWRSLCNPSERGGARFISTKSELSAGAVTGGCVSRVLDHRRSWPILVRRIRMRVSSLGRSKLYSRWLPFGDPRLIYCVNAWNRTEPLIS